MYEACNEDQIERYVLPIMRGERHECYAITEAESGSDVEGIRATARRASSGDDDYVLNGEKWYVTSANFADFCVFQAKITTVSYGGAHEAAHALFFVDLDSPGIEMVASPLFAHTYAHHHPTYRFTDVRVPEKLRLGAEGQGWEIVCSALQSERSGITEVNRHASALEDLLDLARRSRRGGRPALEDGGVRRKLGSFEARIEAMRLNGMRALTSQLRGDLHQSQASINKLHNCDLLVEMSDLAMQLLGSSASYMGDSEASIDSGRWGAGALAWPATVIGGGTPNVQRNIIAERMLGLPKDD